MSPKSILLILLVGILSGWSDGARILGLFLVPGKSHLIVHSAITHALADAGHDVTIVTTLPLAREHPRYRHIHLNSPAFDPSFVLRMVNGQKPYYDQFIDLTRTVNKSGNYSLHLPEMKRLMEEETFDLVIMGYFYNDFQLGVAAHFKCPVIVSFMVQSIKRTNLFIGNPIEISYVPHILSGNEQPLTFWKRVKDYFISEILEPIMIWIYLDSQQEYMYNRNRTMILGRILFVSLVTVLYSRSESARILGLFTSMMKSHLIIHTSVAKVLTEAGHDVTVVTTIPLPRKCPLCHHILLEAPPFAQSFFREKVNKQKPFYSQFIGLTGMMNRAANYSLNQPAMKRLMQDESFDLVILGYFFNDFQLGVAAHFKCPVIVSFMVQSIKRTNLLVGNPSEISYVPHILSGNKQPMAFLERVKDYFISEIFEPFMMWTFWAGLQKCLYNYNFPPDKYPSLDEMRKNVSLVLANHHFSQGPIRPNVPALIEIGGIQVKEKPDPLPEDLKTILDNAKNGVIYFSFGSNVQGNVLDAGKAKIFFNVVSKLPYTVLWKWGDSHFPGQSPNVIYKTWLPQDDILAHPNVKLFITHGGQGSLVESQYRGVPVVGIPLFAEQHANMAKIQRIGHGLLVDYATLSEQSLGNAVHEVLSNNRYRDNVQQFARLYKDRPMSARETVIFWVEYVLRHHGAPHMQSPAVHLNHLQLMSLDVIGFLLAVVLLVLFTLKISCSFVCSRWSRSKNKQE